MNMRESNFSGLRKITKTSHAVEATCLQRQVAVLSRIEAKLDLLLKQDNIKFDLHAMVSNDIIEALRQNKKISAI